MTQAGRFADSRNGQVDPILWTTERRIYVSFPDLLELVSFVLFLCVHVITYYRGSVVQSSVRPQIRP